MTTQVLDSHTSDLLNLVGIDTKVMELHFDQQIQKMMHAEEGVGWSEEQCRAAEVQYRRFLTLMLHDPDELVVPDKLIDTFWHYHILDTRKYFQDTEAVFGRYIHHYPYFGLRSEEDRVALESAFDRTNKLFTEYFGLSMSDVSAACSGEQSSCRSCISR